jgi:hypothetical protein
LITVSFNHLLPRKATILTACNPLVSILEILRFPPKKNSPEGKFYFIFISPPRFLDKKNVKLDTTPKGDYRISSQGAKEEFYNKI